MYNKRCEFSSGLKNKKSLKDYRENNKKGKAMNESVENCPYKF